MKIIISSHLCLVHQCLQYSNFGKICLCFHVIAFKQYHIHTSYLSIFDDHSNIMVGRKRSSCSVHESRTQFVTYKSIIIKKSYR